MTAQQTWEAMPRLMDHVTVALSELPARPPRGADESLADYRWRLDRYYEGRDNARTLADVLAGKGE